MDPNKQLTQNGGNTPPAFDPFLSNPVQDNTSMLAQVQGVGSDPYNPTPNNALPQNQPSPKKSSSSKKLKKALPLIIILSVVLILCVLAGLLLPNLSKPNYKAISDKMDVIETILPATIENCEKVRKNINSDVVNNDMYDTMIGSCRKSIENTYQQFDEAEQLSAKIQDPRIQKLFANFRTAFGTYMPGPDKIGATAEVYSSMRLLDIAMRNFKLTDTKSSGLEAATKNSEIASCIDTFIKAENNKLSDYGKQLSKLYKKLIETQQEYEKLSIYNTSDAESQQAYNLALDEYTKAFNSFKEYYESDKPDITTLYPLGDNADDKITGEFETLKDALDILQQQK